MNGPKIPNPNAAAAAGLKQQIADYPFTDIISQLQQTGGDATLINPATGKPQDYNFTGAGTAENQNQVSAQMAQVLLNIQQGYGAAFIQQRLQDLQQADPTGYAAYGQLFDQIQKDIQQTPPDMPLSQTTQSAIQGVLTNSQSLSPEALAQVQNQARAGNVASGVYLGNAPAQTEANAVVNATDQQNQQAQDAAEKYLSSGVTPEDIQFRATQQNAADLGAFINGQTPTAQFGSLSGASGGAAPYPNTGYSQPTLNEGQAAQQGINESNSIYGIQNQISQGQVNPFSFGLNLAGQGVNLYNSAFGGTNPWSTGVSPLQSGNALNEFGGTGAAGMTGGLPADTGASLPDLSGISLSGTG